MAIALYYKQQRTPGAGTRRARNWQTITFGKRITNKHGKVTDWEAVSPPYKHEPWDRLCRIDVRCVGCGRFFVRFLNDIIQAKTSRCVRCSNASRAKRKAPQVGENHSDPGPDACGR
jgi:hypothetical protein